MDAVVSELENYCDRWLDAWNGNRPDRLLSFYAEDAFYLDPARPEGVNGRDALARYFARLLGANPVMEWTRERLYPVEGGFVVAWRARVPVAGVDVTFRGADVVLLRDGFIARNEVYFDMTPWREALARASAVTG